MKKAIKKKAHTHTHTKETQKWEALYLWPQSDHWKKKRKKIDSIIGDSLQWVGLAVEVGDAGVDPADGLLLPVSSLVEGHEPDTLVDLADPVGLVWVWVRRWRQRTHDFASFIGSTSSCFGASYILPYFSWYV